MSMRSSGRGPARTRRRGDGLEIVEPHLRRRGLKVVILVRPHDPRVVGHFSSGEWASSLL